MGDAFPDFDSMTPEEQMAWLESLAKRQGVKDEELTTKADLDIPVPENAEVDEPGYVPFEGSASARKLKEAAARAQAEPETPAVEAAEEPAWFEAEALEAAEPAEEFEFFAEAQAEPETPAVEKAEEPAWFEAEALESAEPPEEIEVFAEAGDEVDPMLWLDSLSAQPEGDAGDLASLFAESDSEALAFEGGELEEFAPEEQPASAGVDDLLGGMDPMAWLESLAKRQGAKSEEFLTSADLQVEEVPEDAVVDEPGYVPFEGSASARRLKEAAQAEPEPMPEIIEEQPEPAGAELFEEFASPEMPEPDFEALVGEAELGPGEEELLSGADPMLWLESLAKRQGAKSEELLTEADMQIPELPEDTVIDEPGYVEYSPFGILPPDQEFELPEISAREEMAAEDEALSWLAEFAAEPDEDLSEILAFGEEMFEPVAEEEAAPARVEKPRAADPLAGMTDEEIAYAQAHGQLTGEQELAWLKRQAAKLAKVRESQEMAPAEEAAALEPAEPAELPPWLVQMRVEAEQEDAGALVPELGAESVDLSGWLEEAPAPEAELNVAEITFDAAELTEADVDSLWLEVPADQIGLEEPGLPDDSELAKFLAEGIVPQGADPLAEALDAEYDRKLVGDEAEPDWYTDAVAKVASEAPAVEEPAMTPAAEMPQESVVEAALVDMPDWLKEAEEEVKEVGADEAAMPDWLRETPEAEPAVEGRVPDWLAEPVEEPAVPTPSEELPTWLRDLDKAPEPVPEAKPIVEAAVIPVSAPPPEPAKPAPAAKPEIPKPAPVPPVVRGELLEQIAQRLKQNPADHTSRLAFARALRDGQQLVPSLDQYEMLIDGSQLLQDVSNDLAGLSEEHADVPRVRRLLGDTYMRRGMLQEALDAYRSALEHL
jgi:hypothetical protein